ncbi:MAG: hypothetical protein J6A19_11435 [Oscillospiraceae bacterium]|nr:hypothetical protein [Oscillospiraceae bacterium]
MTGFEDLNLGIDGDSITAGEQWSFHVYKNLGMKSHSNVAVGSSVWYKRTAEIAGTTVTTQDYGSEDFAGISDGWEPTEDVQEMQKRMNNCAVVHIQRFLAEVKNGIFPEPDIFVFAMGTNDLEEFIGDPEKALTGKELSDNSNIDLFTEAGAARWCIQTIRENFPNCRVFVMTPIQTATPEHNKKIEKTIECLKKICRGLSVQVIDAYSNSGICEKFEVIGGRGRYLKDGLHPELNGQALEGAFATKEIRNNYF